MTVQQLIDHLSTLPPEAEVLTSRCSDYGPVDAQDVTEVLALPGPEWWTRSHRTMTEEQKAHLRPAVHID